MTDLTKKILKVVGIVLLITVVVFGFYALPEIIKYRLQFTTTTQDK